MLDSILDYLSGNLYLTVWLFGLPISYIFGWALVSESYIGKKYNIKGYMGGIAFAMSWFVVGGIFLIFLWAFFTISEFFAIPIIVLIALIIVVIAIVWIIKRVLQRQR